MILMETTESLSVERLMMTHDDSLAPIAMAYKWLYIPLFYSKFHLFE